MTDLSTLTQCLSALLQPNTEIVKQASNYLTKTARLQPNYCQTLLTLAMTQTQSNEALSAQIQ